MRLVYGFVGVVFTLALVLYPLMAVSFSSGAPPGFNGAPGGNGNCTACHFSFDVNSGTGSVSIDAPKTFLPNQTISFTVSVDNTTDPFPDGAGSQQGFQVSVQDPDGNDVGTLVIADAANTRFADKEGLYVTHTSDGIQLDTWEVQWTADGPRGPTEVTIYVAGNAGNGGEGPGGDYIYTASQTMTRMEVANEDEAAPLVARLDAVYPNPFASSATVVFTLERPMRVELTLYNGVGQAVQVLAQGTRAAGSHQVNVSAEELPAGVYFVEVRTAEGTDVRPITLVR